MKFSKKQQNIIAKRFATLSMDGENVSLLKVKEVLSECEKTIPASQLRLVLKAYYTEIARKLSFSELRVEYAGNLLEESTHEIVRVFSEMYQRTLTVVPIKNDNLLTGVRVRIGDDIYDGSAEAKLLKFQKKINNNV